MCPVFPTPGSGDLFNINESVGSIQPALRAYAPNVGIQSGEVVKFNSQFCNAGIASSVVPAFVTSTNDCAMLFQGNDTNTIMYQMGTLQVGTEFFIRLGLQGNALLWSTGTTDPQI